MNRMAEFLRGRRTAIDPEEVGLPPGTNRRRTPGLRREEVATLAGVSRDYYSRIEQGKETAPSDAILHALATALRLSEDERVHLLSLADNAGGRSPRCRPVVPRSVGRGLELLLESVRPNPGYVLSKVDDVLAANPEGLALMPGLADQPEADRNMIRYLFTHPAARKLLSEWDAVVRDCVAHLHTAELTCPDEAAELVAELSAASVEFGELWRRHEVWSGAGNEITFRHPTVGDLTLTGEVLFHADEMRFLTYQAPSDSAEHDALILLARSDHDVRVR